MTLEVGNGAPAAAAFAAAKRGDRDEAARIVASLAEQAFGMSVGRVEISRDSYSLNSINGFLVDAAGEEFFFKFHHEEGEERTLRELYQAEILRAAGYPVDVPVHASREIGRQLLLYRRRRSPRFADLCRDLDFAEPAAIEPALRAQEALDDLTAAIYLRSLHVAAEADVMAEPVHQLFHARLVDPERPKALGGRARRFFFDRDFTLAGVTVEAERLRRLTWRINGTLYSESLGQILERSRQLLSPRRLARFGAVTAHGDAHNANVWWEEEPQGPRLLLFDPAFAGAHLPALLAEAKATFHNIFAHPLWLYDPGEAARRFQAKARINGDVIEIETDWRLPPLRQGFLTSKTDRLWRPLLAELSRRSLLPADWRATLRSALFACPTLVMDLAAGGAGGHNPTSSTIALAVAMMAGAEPEPETGDPVRDFLDRIDPSRIGGAS
jgi:Ser/Thr protein kinase RdoA (MazF antagonist)